MYIATRHKNPFAAMKLERKVWNKAFVIDKGWEILLYLTCLFPFTMWLPFFNTATDTQPYAIVVAFFCLIYYFLIDKDAKDNHKMSKFMMVLTILCVLMGSLAFLSMPDAGLVRVAKQYVMYMSMIMIPLSVFLVWKKNGGMNETLIKICIWVWFLCGIIQKTINPYFGNRFVMRQSTSWTRGVVGFATEPSAYGFFCFFLMLIAFSFQKNRLLYIGLLIIQIFGFAESTVSLMYFGVYIIGYFLNEIVLRKKFALLKVAIISAGGFGTFYYAYIKGFLPTRMNWLAMAAFRGDWKYIIYDESIAERIGGIVDSFQAFVANRGMPHGFGGDRAFSGVGILLVEGGVISIFLLGVIALLIWRAYPKKYRFLFVFGFLITMLSAIPFSSPIVCFYLGYCVYQGFVHKEDPQWK